MTYKLLILKSAQKQLSKLPARDYRKVKQVILDLAANPRPVHCSKLKYRDGYRIRQGDYRIIYQIQDDVLTVLVVKIGHRRDIYRD